MSYSGNYFDGKTARPVAVSVSFGASGLVLTPDGGGPIIQWAYLELDSAERLVSGKAVRLSPTTGQDARLLIDDPKFSTELVEKVPHLTRRFARRGLRRSEIWFIVLASATSLLLLAAFIPATNQYLVRFFPESLERRLGNQTRAFLVGSKATCRDPGAQAIIDKLTAELIANHNITNLRVRIVDWGLPNAFALAGGEIVFTQGIMKKLANGNQFAGVLAHEIAHQKEKHPVQALLRVYGLQFIVQILFGDDSIVTSLGGAAVLMAFSREMESQADKIAVDLLQGANIDASGLAGFFKTLRTMEGRKRSKIFNYVSTHPGTDKRIKALRKISGQPGLPAMSDTDWRKLRRLCGEEFKKIRREKSNGADDKKSDVENSQDK